MLECSHVIYIIYHVMQTMFVKPLASLWEESSSSCTHYSSSLRMWNHVNSLQASVQLSPLRMHVQSDGQHDREHVQDSRLITTSGAGEPVIHLLTGVDRKGRVPSPTLGIIIKKSYNGGSVLSTSLGSKTLNNTSSLGLGGGGTKI